MNGRCSCNIATNISGMTKIFGCFNTVHGKHCYLIPFVLPSLRSGTCNVRTSSSLCSSAVSHPSAHIVNGRYCCNSTHMLGFSQLRHKRFNTVNGKYYFLFTFVLPSLRSGKQYVGLIVALLLCCLTRCGAYRRR